MRVLPSILFLLLLCFAQSLHAAQVLNLARCTGSVFQEIGRTGRWSGKAPASCPQVAVTNESGGIVVTAWGMGQAPQGWEEIAFSTSMEYGEVSDKGKRAMALDEIMARAGIMERCLQSLKKENDPGECRTSGSREYLVGEETGVEDRQTLWLDGGRHCQLWYSTGNSSMTPTPVAPPGELLPPGVVLDIFLRPSLGNPRF